MVVVMGLCNIASRVRSAVGYLALLSIILPVIVSCGNNGTTQRGTPRSLSTGTPVGKPNLAFSNPEQLTDGVIQVVNNGNSPAESYVDGRRSSFGVYITKGDDIQLGYTVRKEEGKKFPIYIYIK